MNLREENEALRKIISDYERQTGARVVSVELTVPPIKKKTLRITVTCPPADEEKLGKAIGKVLEGVFHLADLLP